MLCCYGYSWSVGSGEHCGFFCAYKMLFGLCVMLHMEALYMLVVVLACRHCGYSTGAVHSYSDACAVSYHAKVCFFKVAIVCIMRNQLAFSAKTSLTATVLFFVKSIRREGANRLCPSNSSKSICYYSDCNNSILRYCFV